MGIAYFLKTLANPKLNVEDTLRREYAAYANASEALDGCADPHVTLAQVWLAHKTAARMIDPRDPVARQRAFEQTWQFSVIPWPQSVRALGLQLLHEERPHLVRKVPACTRELNELLSPVQKSKQSGEFLARYEETNPNVLYEASKESDTGWYFDPL
jgi:hypothetical protein